MSSWQSILNPLPTEALPLAVPALALMPLTELGLVRLRGEESEKFLQGQITADLTQLAPNQATLAAQCDPKGKMLGLFTLLRHQGDVLLIEARDAIATQLPGMAKFAVFNKVALTDASDELLLLGLAGNEAEKALNAAGLETPKDALHVISNDHGLVLKTADNRFIVALSPDAMATLVNTLNGSWYQAAAWQGLDVVSATPWLPAALQGEYIPQQLNIDTLGGISFEKGCYIGQEVVARMHFRGGNKKTLWQLGGKAATTPKAGDEIELKLGENYRRGGIVVAAYQFAEGQLRLLAVANNDLEPDSQFRVKDQPDSSLSLISG
ncbi:tRNA-modifying protein YgfZ [Gallaecimonas mangrovi]|uniref:tRNA-modifying protein YgfZ n=1 Tax=Gallaecimonas mangrovi TaxID=2291597 RepID=UPI001867C575|nr:tRNA-modifying protein YgfZ [Gallaecimonas mangrovi]